MLKTVSLSERMEPAFSEMERDSLLSVRLEFTSCCRRSALSLSTKSHTHTLFSHNRRSQRSSSSSINSQVTLILHFLLCSVDIALLSIVGTLSIIFSLCSRTVSYKVSNYFEPKRRLRQAICFHLPLLVACIAADCSVLPTNSVELAAVSLPPRSIDCAEI